MKLLGRTSVFLEQHLLTLWSDSLNQRYCSLNGTFSYDTSNEGTGDRIGISGIFRRKKRDKCNIFAGAMDYGFTEQCSQNKTPLLMDPHKPHPGSRCCTACSWAPGSAALSRSVCLEVTVWEEAGAPAMLYFIDCEVSKWLTCANPKTEMTPKTEPHRLLQWMSICCSLKPLNQVTRWWIQSKGTMAGETAWNNHLAGITVPACWGIQSWYLPWHSCWLQSDNPLFYFDDMQTSPDFPGRSFAKALLLETDI